MNKNILLTLLMIVIFLMSGCSSNDSNGYYNGIKWGSTIAEVEQKLGNNVGVSDDKRCIFQTVENFENIEGSQALITYWFEDDKICEVTITFFPSTKEPSVTDDELHQQVYNNFVKKYGEHSEFSSDYIWETKHSTITFSSVSNCIQYKMIEEPN